MLLHRILMMGLLLAPEGEGGGGGAGGSGAAEGQAGAGAAAGSGAGAGADVIPRAEAQKAFADRDAAKRETRELRERLEKLEREREQAGTQQQPGAGAAGGIDPKGRKPDEEMPAWARELRDLTLSVKDELKADKKQQTRKGIVDTILAEVPDGNRGTVEIMLDGLEARGELSLHGDDKTAVAKTAIAKLKASHATLFVPVGSSRHALQAGTDGKFPWSEVKTEADIPPDKWSEVPPDVLERITRSGGRGDGMLLTSGKPKPKAN